MSEFGKGLTYCLGLFLAHAERSHDTKKSYDNLNSWAQTWFYSAGDHLFDFEIPEFLSKRLQNRLKKFRDFVLNRRCGEVKIVTEKDVKYSIQEAKNLLRIIDKHFGIKTKRGNWE